MFFIILWQNAEKILAFLSMELKKYLKLNNISRREFAEKIGVSHSTIVNWCLGRTLPHADWIEKIFKASKKKVTRKDILYTYRKNVEEDDLLNWEQE